MNFDYIFPVLSLFIGGLYFLYSIIDKRLKKMEDQLFYIVTHMNTKKESED